MRKWPCQKTKCVHNTFGVGPCGTIRYHRNCETCKYFYKNTLSYKVNRFLFPTKNYYKRMKE